VWQLRPLIETAASSRVRPTAHAVRLFPGKCGVLPRFARRLTPFGFFWASAASYPASPDGSRRSAFSGQVRRPTPLRPTAYAVRLFLGKCGVLSRFARRLTPFGFYRASAAFFLASPVQAQRREAWDSHLQPVAEPLNCLPWVLSPFEIFFM
jgi:hypothetical protein